MFTLHVAHLILQQDSQPETQIKNQAEKPPTIASIWQSHQRACLHDTLRFMQQDMLLSLESELFYGQIRADITRLKLSFPDLF